jgi:UDP-N-acetylmuramoyl-L-alanyl-D-glutamate--2,6-diaminopimelate ligase
VKLSELLKHVTHGEVRGPVDRIVAGIAYDSRRVKPETLFVAIPGGRHDGLEFAEEALRRGAGVVVSPHARLAVRDATHVQVADARRALAEAADAFYRHPSGRLMIAGVTGTNGKTTTTFLLRDMLAAAGRAPGLVGTVCYEVGGRVIPADRTTPEASDLQAMFDQMLQAGCSSVVMEVSSHALAQERVHGIDFDVAIFTNLTRDHLDYHKTMEQYFEAKRRLFMGLGQGAKQAVAVINHDDPWGRRLAEAAELKARVITFGLEPGADVGVESLALDGHGGRFRIKSPWGAAELRTPLLGRYNVSNALGAYVAGRALGLEEGVVQAALARRASVPGRLEEVPTGRGWRVLVDYAHTDDALSNVLRTVRPLVRGRLIVVFGCGGDRDPSKRPLMGRVAGTLADRVILTSDNPRREEPRAIIEQILAGIQDRGRCEVVEDRAQAIAAALDEARDGDLVLIAGKGHENTQEFASTIIPFDDRQVARQLLRQGRTG